MSISKKSTLKNDVVNDILERLWQLPEQSRLPVLGAVFSVLVEINKADPVETAGRFCATYKILKENGDLKQYDQLLKQ
jgi:hypothetical protein